MRGWKPTRAARARTLDELNRDLAAIPGERAALSRELSDIDTAMPELLLDEPTRALAAEKRKIEIAAQLSTLDGRESRLGAEIGRLQREADEKEKAAERAAATKEARSLRTLVDEIANDATKLKAKIDKLEAHRERAAAAGVPDAEFLVRSKPGRIRPAIMDDPKTVWFDGNGRRFATNMTTDIGGRVIEATDRVARQVVDVIREESQDPPSMPTRFVDAIKLVDLEGCPL